MTNRLTSWVEAMAKRKTADPEDPMRYAASYNVVYDETELNYRVVVVEEPPRRRPIEWRDQDANVTTMVDIPTPWVYTYLKFAKTTKKGWQVWDARVFFSHREIKNVLTDKVSMPYVTNLSRSAEVCWGYNFSYEVSADLREAIPYCLNAFWMRQFNAELRPTSTYLTKLTSFLALPKVTGRLEGLQAIGKLDVAALMEIKIKPTLLMPSLAWFPRHEEDQSRDVNHYLLANARVEDDNEDEDVF